MTDLSDPYRGLPDAPVFTVTSSDITHGETLPAAHVSGIFGAGGEDLSPQLAWSGFPAETKSFVITCYDPDAPTLSGFWHWAVFNIPGSQYLGAAPPVGHGPHRYIFIVHALGAERLDVDPGATPAFLMFNLLGQTLGRASLTAVYEQK
jgi:phosphatidylethanolamine-binding protein (PEBP) family uncharacterized protein